jgi:hypothetical protein
MMLIETQARSERSPSMFTNLFCLQRAACLLSTGCTATHVALQHGRLNVQTKMSHTVFLAVEKQAAHTVFLDIKNTSAKNIEIEPLIRQKLQAKGYRVTATRRKRSTFCKPTSSVWTKPIRPPWSNPFTPAGPVPLAGGLAGAMIGATTHGPSGAGYGAGISGLVATRAELVAGSLVKNVTYTITTNIQLAEKTDEPVEQTVQSALAQGTGTTVQQTSQSVRERRNYQARIASTANKVNLKFEDARL